MPFLLVSHRTGSYRARYEREPARARVERAPDERERDREPDDDRERLDALLRRRLRHPFRSEVVLFWLFSYFV
jgi:hypothetical protein